MAKKVQPRRHNRRPIKQNTDEGVVARRNAAVLRFDLAFRGSLPQHPGTGQNAVSGNYAQVEGDAYDGKEYPVADGKYRVEGSDWIFTFEGGGFVEAEHARPPEFGGKDVITVPRGAPPNG